MKHLSSFNSGYQTVAPTTENTKPLTDESQSSVSKQPEPKSKLTPKKGKPTPSRKVAQKKTGPISRPPQSRAEAKKARKLAAPLTKAEKKEAKAQRRRLENENRMRMLRGEDDYLLPKDKGPEKRLLREIVDNRASISNYTIIVVALLYIFTTAAGRNPKLQIASYIILFIFLVILVIDAIVIFFLLKKKLQANFPKIQLKTSTYLRYTMYAMSRNVTLPRLRRPKPSRFLAKKS